MLLTFIVLNFQITCHFSGNSPTEYLLIKLLYMLVFGHAHWRIAIYDKNDHTTYLIFLIFQRMRTVWYDLGCTISSKTSPRFSPSVDFLLLLFVIHVFVLPSRLLTSSGITNRYASFGVFATLSYSSPLVFLDCLAVFKVFFYRFLF